MKITDNTSAVLGEARRRVSAGLVEIAPAIVATAKQDVAVVSGDLRESITAEVKDDKIVVGSHLPYAPEVEMNKPFLRPALEKARSKIKRVFKI